MLTSPAHGQAPRTLPGNGEEVSVLADRIEQVGADGLLVATGNVEISRGGRRLRADRVELNRETGEATAQGRAEFFDGEDRLAGDRIDFNFRSGTGVVYNGAAFSPPYYRLSGERIERVGERVYNIRRGIFTTCEADPPPWSFKAAHATADLEEFIVGRDVSFWVSRFPLVPWIPLLAAPIRRERQTGFLLPRLGVSSQKGFTAKIPFFWAIDDSQDLTLSLNTFTERGLGLGGEYRYVLSESSRGTVEGSLVRELFRDSDDRGIIGFTHDSQLTPRLSLKADVNVTSDDRYLRQYGDSLRERGLQRIESNISVSQRWESWSLVGNALWYQDLTTRRPVELQRLPEIKLNGARQPLPGAGFLSYEVESGFTNFVREVGPGGRRLDLHPRITLPLSVAGYFSVTPFAGGRATYYDARVTGKRLTRDGRFEVEETRDASFIRGLGEVGADLEARATRIYDAGGTAGIASLQHLIEPRVNITEIRGVNQKGIPRFEPGSDVVNPLVAPLADLGIDRIDRISRLTYSVTNRLNAKTVAGTGEQAVRWELVRFALGQAYDLPPNKQSERFSDLVGDLIVQPSQRLRFRGDARYDVYGRGFRTANSDISASVRDVSATVGTRFDDQAEIEFVKGELQARLASFLEVRGGTNWDTREGVPVENRFGANLRFQCWGISLEYIDRHKSEDEFRFSVNLLGLGTLGSR
jgi:LPS-assembly protein